jgi:hypothetical protein
MALKKHFGCKITGLRFFLIITIWLKRSLLGFILGFFVYYYSWLAWSDLI